MSRPDRPYGETLAVPSLADLPFELDDWGVRRPDSQWVKFVDFARPLLEDGDPQADRSPAYLVTRDRKDPDVYGLATGTDESGGAATARWTPEGFKIVHRWGWSGSPWGDY